MTMSSVTIRVDEDVKNRAAQIAEEFGFDLSSVTRAFYKQMIRERRIPLNLSHPEPNKESLESIKAAEEIISKDSSGYSNTEDMFKAMEV